jgi:hypothetical protein
VTSRAKQRLPIPQPHPSDGEAERPERPASFFLREEIGRFVALRRGCCLSEASFSTFRYKPHDFSKKNAALIFCFFLIKQKEKGSCNQGKRKKYLESANPTTISKQVLPL